jgi:peptidyl-prolyl cis-trans isomerase B (cyclophilin B)
MFFRLIFALVLMIISGAQVIYCQTPSPSPTPDPAALPKANPRPTPKPYEPKPEPFDKADVKTMASQCVTLETEPGNIVIELYPESAPESVRNFLNLAASGDLDTTTFSRIVPGFVIQGGNLYSREGKMTYDLGMRARRPLVDEPNKILHQRGVVSMARGDEANSATTNFFILVSDAHHLDGTFAAFGRVTKGMETVDEINKMPVEGEKPVKPVRIKKAVVAACMPQ